MLGSSLKTTVVSHLRPGAGAAGYFAGLLSSVALLPLVLQLPCGPPSFLRSSSAMASSEPASVSPYSMVFVTAPNSEVATKLAQGLVSEKLAACVNMVPQITSVYLWQGKVEKDDEVLMMIKTRTTVVDAVSEFVRKNHPYDVAEVISTSIEKGNQPYLDWIGQSVPERK